jgi:hypothetical protein
MERLEIREGSVDVRTALPLRAQPLWLAARHVDGRFPRANLSSNTQ